MSLSLTRKKERKAKNRVMTKDYDHKQNCVYSRGEWGRENK